MRQPPVEVHGPSSRPARSVRTFIRDGIVRDVEGNEDIFVEHVWGPRLSCARRLFFFLVFIWFVLTIFAVFIHSPVQEQAFNDPAPTPVPLSQTKEVGKIDEPIKVDGMSGIIFLGEEQEEIGSSTGLKQRKLLMYQETQTEEETVFLNFEGDYDPNAIIVSKALIPADDERAQNFWKGKVIDDNVVEDDDDDYSEGSNESSDDSSDKSSDESSDHLRSAESDDDGHVVFYASFSFMVSGDNDQ